MRSGISRARYLAAASVVALTAVTGASAAWAQDASAASNASTVNEVVVTGSRIARRDFVADSPIVTVKTDTLSMASDPTLDSQLERLPQFSSSLNGQAAGSNGFGQTGQATLNLRNLGDSRNLVLLDGRRLQPSSTTFAVDINTLPSAIIDSVEVITGGASAVYGSDALAGVVNFKLKHDFQGLEIDAHASTSGRGDNTNTNFSVAAGTNFAHDKGNLFMALDFTDRGEVLYRDLPFFQRGFAAGTAAQTNTFLGLGEYVPGADVGPPGTAAYAAVLAAESAAIGGPVGPFASTLGFNSDHATLFNPAGGAGYNSGVYPQNPIYALAPAGPSNGFVPTVSQNNYYYSEAITPLTRYSAFAHGTFEINDDVSAYAQALFTHYSVENGSWPNFGYNFWATSVPHDAAHPVPASLEAVLDARPDPSAPWTLGQTTNYAGPEDTINDNNVYQVIFGLNGRIPGNDWTWDIYGSHGETDVTSTTETGAVSTPKVQTLLDQPGYGAGYTVNGVTECTSGISPFIAGPVSADCIDYIGVHPVTIIEQRQDVLEASLQGKLFDLPAGELRFAAGADYRRNTYQSKIDDSQRVDPAVCATCADIPGTFGVAPTQGVTSVKEIYGELLVPILKEVPLVKSFNIDLGFRYSDYALSGGVDSYKIDGNWQITDSIRLRGGFQHAVRAPNPLELFGAPQGTVAFGFDPCVGANAATAALCGALTPGPGTAAQKTALYTTPGYIGQGSPFYIGQSFGNPNLTPETANTFTFGGVFQPTVHLPLNSNVSLSADYYNINIKNVIGIITSDRVYNECFNIIPGGNPTLDPNNPYCQLITRAPLTQNGIPVSVDNNYANLGGDKTQGIDVEANLGLPVGPGRFNINVVANYLISFKLSAAPGSAFLENAGYGDDFRWKTLTTFSYALGSADISLRWKHLPPVKDSSCVGVPACATPGAGAYDLFDVFGNYAVTPKIRLSVGIDNLFNRDPEVTMGLLGNTNAFEYDIVGRTYFVGLKARF